MRKRTRINCLSSDSNHSWKRRRKKSDGKPLPNGISMFLFFLFFLFRNFDLWFYWFMLELNKYISTQQWLFEQFSGEKEKWKKIVPFFHHFANNFFSTNRVYETVSIHLINAINYSSSSFTITRFALLTFRLRLFVRNYTRNIRRYILYG